MAKILLSHSSKDKPTIRQLADDLRKLGHEPWLDEWEIRVGQCIMTRIEEGLVSADYVVVALSEHSVKSGWVEREWKTKYWDEIQQGKTLVLPALLTDCEIPPLLKTKKYADFRASYPVGLVQLVGAISPTLSNTGTDKVTNTPIQSDKKIADLLAKAHSKSTPLSQTISEALAFALESGNASLADFCRNELVGWKTDAPEWRRVQAHMSLQTQLNPDYHGWTDAQSILAFVRSDPDFFPIKLGIQFALSFIESRDVSKGNRSVLGIELRVGDVIPNSPEPNRRGTAYAPANTLQVVLEHIRVEFVKRLVSLLPGPTTIDAVPQATAPGHTPA